MSSFQIDEGGGTTPSTKRKSRKSRNKDDTKGSHVSAKKGMESRGKRVDEGPGICRGELEKVLGDKCVVSANDRL